MKALLVALTVGVLAVSGAQADEGAAAEPVLVSVDAGAEAMLRRAGGTLVSRRMRLWRVPGRSARAVLAQLRATGRLRRVEPEVARHRLDTTAGDPLLAGEWWLDKIGASGLSPPQAGVPVTIVDSGIDASHPEFASRPGTTLLNAQTLRGAQSFHATAVASVLGAPANGIGLVGVHPSVELRSWDASPGAAYTSADVVAGIEAGAAQGRGVINLSIGGLVRSRFEQDAVEHAFSRGAIVVAACGNDRTRSSPPSYPASLPHVVTVGATGATDLVAYFSSASSALDVVAPGDGIIAAVPLVHDASGYSTVAGTSFAAPMVSAAIAWLWGARPELEKTQVIEIVRRTAVDLGPRGRDPDTGFGLIDLRAALTARAPRADPFEPNDFAQADDDASAITTPLRIRATVRARLDVDDDPRDVYSVWLPARRRTLVRVTQPAVRTFLLRSRHGIVARRVSGGLALDNRSASGTYARVNAFLPLGARPTHLDYRLTVATTRLRPAR